MDNDNKNKYITSDDLAEQTKIILGAIDGRFNKVDERFNKVDERFDRAENRLEEVRDELKTDIKNVQDELYIVRDELKTDIKNVQDELYIVRDELKADINNVQTLIDGYVKAQEDFKEEFVIVKEEGKQMKQVFKDKLGVEIRAF